MKIKLYGGFNCGNVGDNLIALILMKYIESFFGRAVDVSVIPPGQQWKQIKQADVLIIGGGGLIYDYDMNNVRNYCEAIHYAFAHCVPIYFMGVGVQHVFTTEAKEMYRQALPKVRAIATRGTLDSEFIMNELAYDPVRLITSRDVVFLHDQVMAPTATIPLKKKEKPILALSLADWKLGGNYHHIEAGLDRTYREYRAYLEETLPKLKDRFKVRVVLQANEDIEICNYLAKIFKTEIITIPSIQQAADLIKIYRSSDYVITNRYHGLIAALIARTPALGVSFATHKAERLIQDSFPSLTQHFYTIGNFVAEDILSKMLDEAFISRLKTAELDEYEQCIRETRKQDLILTQVAQLMPSKTSKPNLTYLIRRTRNTKQSIPHIQVDAQTLIEKHISGVGHYALAIVREFDKLAKEGKLTYSLIVPEYGAKQIKKYRFRHSQQNIINPIQPSAIRKLMMDHHYCPFDNILGKGHYYFPAFLAWPTLRSDATAVIHDVIYLTMPECVEKNTQEYLEKAVPFSIKNTKNILTVSEFSKAEIVKYCNVDPNTISVAYPAVDRARFYRRSEREIHKVKTKYGIQSNKYILSVGNLEPRKNHQRLIEAYIKLPREITHEYALVLVGADGWSNEDIWGAIRQARESGYNIIQPQRCVSDDDMPAIYSGATFFVFVSIYEGFGSPPIEAYACGTPVIASPIASIQEALTQPALYVDPYNVHDIRDKMLEMLHKIQENPYQFNSAMETHVSTLSWRRAAEITAATLTGLPLEYFQEKKARASSPWVC